MEISYTIFDLLFYLLLYAFLGWCVEVFCAAVKSGRFVNRGFLNLPLNMPCGIAAALLLPVLGTMNHKTILQYIMTLVIYILVRCVTDQFVRGVSRGTFAAAPKGRPFFLNAAAAAAVMLLVYLVVHPGMMGLLYLMPKWLERTLVIAGIVLILADFIGVMRALRTSSATRLNKAGQETTQRMADRISNTIWRRLQKAYPGLAAADVPGPERYVFARGRRFRSPDGLRQHPCQGRQGGGAGRRFPRHFHRRAESLRRRHHRRHSVGTDRQPDFQSEG